MAADFAGPAFHTARWDHGVDLAGKDVVMIGAGATGFQLAPAIAGTVGRLTIFQRTRSSGRRSFRGSPTGAVVAGPRPSKHLRRAERGFSPRLNSRSSARVRSSSGMEE